jgi:glyoxylase-like metal-dependent hydrolase (beta-lactamase superfamily II)
MDVVPDIYASFDPETCTWQYIVAKPKSYEAVIIDSVLDFDHSKSLISTDAADKILDIVRSQNPKVTKIPETHAHADHLSAAIYLQQALVRQGKERPEICIGKRIEEVQVIVAKKYGAEPSELEDVFDKLFDDDETFPLGSLTGKILYLPGRTPDHVGYMIGENAL